MRIPLGGMCANRVALWRGLGGGGPPSLPLIYLRLHLGSRELADDPIFMLIKSMAPRVQIKTTLQPRCLRFIPEYTKSNDIPIQQNLFHAAISISPFYFMQKEIKLFHDSIYFSEHEHYIILHYYHSLKNTVLKKCATKKYLLIT